MGRYDLTDFEWSIIQPLLPNKPRGVPRVDDRRVLNGIFWVLRTGAPWRDLPQYYGPYTTCYNRFCPSSKHLGRLSLFRNRGSGPSWFDVKPLVADGSSGVSGWSVS